MRQPYFILVLAHSLHGRLRRVHIPHQFLYVVLAVLAFGSVSLFGMLSSYLRMTWKINNYNSLRQEVDTLQKRYQALERVSNQKSEQLASLQMLANEVTLAYGIKQKLEGPNDISAEGKLMPTYRESLAEYDFLKSASYSMLHRNYPKQWQLNVRPSLWPVSGRLLSSYGSRTDPFSGDGAFHTGVDLSATTGTPVHAAGDGVVAHAEWSGRYGKMVVIDHGNGMQTWYAHLSTFDVVPGQEIRLGQRIGLSGGTGRVTSPHLHYEVRMGGTPVNPYPYLTKTSVATTARKDFPF
jgi:murein DD-endopeptidase MepM/ murein hydrolase activator NlpD